MQRCKRTANVLVIAQRVVIVYYGHFGSTYHGCFGSTYRTHPQGSRIQTKNV